VVDRAILEYQSRASGMPMILAALRQYHTPFRHVSHNPFLMPNGIDVDVTSLTIDQLRQRAWAIVEPEFRSRLAKLSGEIEEAKAKGLGSDDLAAVAQAAVQSRVGSLLVEAERRIPGHLDKTTGRITFGNLEDTQVDDLLDDRGVVLRKGGSGGGFRPRICLHGAGGYRLPFLIPRRGNLLAPQHRSGFCFRANNVKTSCDLQGAF
jgi:hypothetical protein